MPKTVIKDGIKYELNKTYACVVGYTEGIPNELIIPNEIEGLPVTSILDEAFEDCDFLLTVQIPNSVTNIGQNAFCNCALLKTVIFGSGIKTIDSLAFSYCVSLKIVTIPNGTTEIDNGTFYNCTALESVFLPDSVNYIGTDVFGGCSSLKTLYLPKLQEKISKKLFYEFDISPKIYFRGIKKEFEDMFTYNISEEHIAINSDGYCILTTVICTDENAIY